MRPRLDIVSSFRKNEIKLEIVKRKIDKDVMGLECLSYKDRLDRLQ